MPDEIGTAAPEAHGQDGSEVGLETDGKVVGQDDDRLHW
jgi:hypothetical protein